MSLKQEIVPYLTFDGYVSPHPVPPGTIRSCDNHIMFTSEYYIMLKRHGLLTEADKAEYVRLIKLGMVAPGLVARFPNDRGNAPPDDYIAVAAACVELELPSLGLEILTWGLLNFGCYNPENPVKKTLESFLWRQPQLMVAAYCAAGRTPITLLPFFLLTAIIIATANMRDEVSNSDTRRLAWLLIQCVAPHSWLCRQAAKLWYRRLLKDYGPSGMKEVASIYYQPAGSNPFSRWWA